MPKGVKGSLQSRLGFYRLSARPVMGFRGKMWVRSIQFIRRKIRNSETSN